MRRQISPLILAVIGGSCLSTFALAGPLTPPDGPVAPTLKTLTEIEPRIAINSSNTPGDNDGTPSVYRIVQPGSYYLVGNFTGEAGKRCIEVACDDVTIDLNGMTITGVGSSTGGIYVDGIRNNISIRNGVIKSIGAGPGIDYAIVGGSGWRVESVRVMSCAGVGINVPRASTVLACGAFSNTGTGIKVLEYSQVINCESEQNATGVMLSNYARAIHTTCAMNSSNGIDASSDGTEVIECIAATNGGNGIVGLNGASIARCVVRFNNLAGITTNSSCLIESNEITFSGSNGIATLGSCVVRNNSCNSNGRLTAGAGIFTSATKSRIEGNSCVDNTYGIRVTGSLNFITRNTASGNTTFNWDISANNRCLVVQGVSNAAFSGNAGGTAPGSTDPNANFTY